MFTQLPVRHEQFLWLVVDGMVATHAYAKVYGEDKSRAVCEAAASRLLSSDKVKRRKAEIIAARHAAQPASIEFLTRELVAISGESRALGQGSAAVQAMMGVAKLHGLLVDRVQSDVLIRKPSASPTSPDELSAEQWLSEYAVTSQITKEPEPEPAEIINTSDILTQPEGDD